MGHDLVDIKIRLMTEGMVVSASAATALAAGDEDRPWTTADYPSTSGITLRMAHDVWVNAPISRYNSNFVHDPSLRLEHDGTRFAVVEGERSWGAEPVPVPAYFREHNEQGQPYTDFAHTHADRVRISPVDGCAVACRFCDLPYTARYRKRSPDGLIDAVGRALRDQVLPARHVLISGGTPRPADHGWLNALYEAVVTGHPGVPVDLMMMPVEGLLDLSHLNRVGVRGLSINLEVFDQDVARRTMRGKWKLGRATYLDFIEQAVDEFGPGRVRSLVLVGLEDLDSTLEGVKALAERGCEPVLSPFRPDPATPLASHAPPSVAMLTEAWERCVEVCSAHNVHLGPRCIPCMHNTLSFPDSSGYYYYS